MVPFIPVCYDPDRSNRDRTLWTEQFEMANEEFWRRLGAILKRDGVVHAYREGRIYVHQSFDQPFKGLDARGPYRRIQVRWWTTRGIIRRKISEPIRAAGGPSFATGYQIGPMFGVEVSDSGVGHCKIFRHYFLGPEPWAPEE